MEAVVFFFFFGLYIGIRVLLGGGESLWDRQRKQHRIGTRLLKDGQLAYAKSYFESAHKKMPYDSFILVSLGEIALLENNPERALVFGQKAIRLENGLAETNLLMSKGLYKIGEFAEAMKFAQKAVRFGRNISDTNHLLGLLLLESGNVDEGLSYLEKSYQLREHEEKVNLPKTESAKSNRS